MRGSSLVRLSHGYSPNSERVSQPCQVKSAATPSSQAQVGSDRYADPSAIGKDRSIAAYRNGYGSYVQGESRSEARQRIRFKKTGLFAAFSAPTANFVARGVCCSSAGNESLQHLESL